MGRILNYLRTSPTPKINPMRPLLPGAPPPEHLPLNPLLYLTLAIDWRVVAGRSSCPSPCPCAPAAALL